jgi:hypothetical protein
MSRPPQFGEWLVDALLMVAPPRLQKGVAGWQPTWTRQLGSAASSAASNPSRDQVAAEADLNASPRMPPLLPASNPSRGLVAAEANLDTSP